MVLVYSEIHNHYHKFSNISSPFNKTPYLLAVTYFASTPCLPSTTNNRDSTIYIYVYLPILDTAQNLKSYVVFYDCLLSFSITLSRYVQPFSTGMYNPVLYFSILYFNTVFLLLCSIP